MDREKKRERREGLTYRQADNQRERERQPDRQTETD